MIQLLLHPRLAEIPPSTLSSISEAILLDSTGLNASDTIPSHLESPIPDVGPSSVSTTWTISLLLPLLRACTTNPPTAMVQLIIRILSIVEPYPAPPFDVGLEASQLMGSLPDTISMPLRQSLSGLMTDLAISEGSAQPGAASGSTGAIDQPRPQAGMAGISSGPDISNINLSDTFSNTTQQSIALLLASYRARFGYDRNTQYAANSAVPSEGLQTYLKLCWALGASGEGILEQVVDTTLQQVLPDTYGLKKENVDSSLLLVEGLPVLLKWWKDHSDGRLSYPVSPFYFYIEASSLSIQANLATCLKAVFTTQKDALDAHATWQQTTWETTLAALDGESEDGAFSLPEGWSWVSLREATVRKLADLGLLTAQEVKDVLPDLTVSEPWMGSGESLMVRSYAIKSGLNS